MSKTIDRSQIQINSNSVHFENLNIEDIGWKELSERVRSWDEIVYHRVLKRSNPAEKKILGLLRGINPNVPSTWVDFKGREFKRWIQASFEYKKKEVMSKVEVKLITTPPSTPPKPPHPQSTHSSP